MTSTPTQKYLQYYANQDHEGDVVAAQAQLEKHAKEFEKLYESGPFVPGHPDARDENGLPDPDRHAHNTFGTAFKENPALFHAFNEYWKGHEDYGDGEDVQEALESADNTWGVGNIARWGMDALTGEDYEGEYKKGLLEPWGFTQDETGKWSPPSASGIDLESLKKAAQTADEKAKAAADQNRAVQNILNPGEETLNDPAGPQGPAPAQPQGPAGEKTLDQPTPDKGLSPATRSRVIARDRDPSGMKRRAGGSGSLMFDLESERRDSDADHQADLEAKALKKKQRLDTRAAEEAETLASPATQRIAKIHDSHIGPGETKFEDLDEQTKRARMANYHALPKGHSAKSLKDPAGAPGPQGAQGEEGTMGGAYSADPEEPYVGVFNNPELTKFGQNAAKMEAANRAQYKESLQAYIDDEAENNRTASPQQAAEALAEHDIFPPRGVGSRGESAPTSPDPEMSEEEKKLEKERKAELEAAMGQADAYDRDYEGFHSAIQGGLGKLNEMVKPSKGDEEVNNQSLLDTAVEMGIMTQEEADKPSHQQRLDNIKKRTSRLTGGGFKPATNKSFSEKLKQYKAEDEAKKREDQSMDTPATGAGAAGSKITEGDPLTLKRMHQLMTQGGMSQDEADSAILNKYGLKGLDAVTGGNEAGGPPAGSSRPPEGNVPTPEDVGMKRVPPPPAATMAEPAPAAPAITNNGSLVGPTGKMIHDVAEPALDRPGEQLFPPPPPPATPAPTATMAEPAPAPATPAPAAPAPAAPEGPNVGPAVIGGGARRYPQSRPPATHAEKVVAERNRNQAFNQGVEYNRDGSIATEDSAPLPPPPAPPAPPTQYPDYFTGGSPGQDAVADIVNNFETQNPPTVQPAPVPRQREIEANERGVTTSDASYAPGIEPPLYGPEPTSDIDYDSALPDVAQPFYDTPLNPFEEDDKPLDPEPFKGMDVKPLPAPTRNQEELTHWEPSATPDKREDIFPQQTAGIHDGRVNYKTTDRGWVDRKPGEDEAIRRQGESTYAPDTNNIPYTRGRAFRDPAVSQYPDNSKNTPYGKRSLGYERGPGGHLTDKIPVISMVGGKPKITGYRTAGAMRDDVARQGNMIPLSSPHNNATPWAKKQGARDQQARREMATLDTPFASNNRFLEEHRRRFG